MWYQENKYDMMYSDEILDEDDYEHGFYREDDDYNDFLESLLPCDECDGELDHSDDCPFLPC